MMLWWMSCSFSFCQELICVSSRQGTGGKWRLGEYIINTGVRVSHLFLEECSIAEKLPSILSLYHSIPWRVTEQSSQWNSAASAVATSHKKGLILSQELSKRTQCLSASVGNRKNNWNYFFNTNLFLYLGLYRAGRRAMVKMQDMGKYIHGKVGVALVGRKPLLTFRELSWASDSDCFWPITRLS